ncbi:hypothetical protein [Corynebacterium urealyticum]|uniref:Restriction endonuclease subunit S n=1 Tax=Corynebacterium urealyticum TaxID=43771 RepID=A0A5D4FVZ6_9CORY|nr:hypothetical protein [Corynebacterium urealyticum]TYR20178.1 hypothetical protein FYJ87_04180 [Corynebacterium urealyticum]
MPEFNDLTESDEVTFIPLEDVWPTNKADDFRTVPWEKRLNGYTPFRRGDLLLPKVTPTVTHGRTMITDTATELGVASTEVYTVRARPGADSRWLAYLLVGTQFLGLAGASVQGTGGLKRISTQFVESYPLPDASPDEQRAIADYLDRETAEIDAMTADLDELEKLLTEHRNSIATIFIGNLESDPDTRRVSLNVVADLISSSVDKKSREGEPLVRLVNYTDVYYGDTLTADADYMEATATPEQIERVGVRDGDVIFTKDSETADDIGIPALIRNPDPDMVCGYHLTIARPRRELINPRYLYWILMSGQAKSYWTQAANGVTRFSIGSSATSRLPVVLPPLNRQEKVAAEIDRETAEIDAMLADITELRDLLAERRAAVIAAAVTGQIDIPTAEEPTHA